MPARHPELPRLWLLSDARNDRVLERALAALPMGSAFVYRHYHLGPDERHARFRHLERLARRRGHLVIVSGSPALAAKWGADGIYGAPEALFPRRKGQIRIATAHDLAELGLAKRILADAAMLSPVFGTRSHPDETPIKGSRFGLLRNLSAIPVIALGGMDARKARLLGRPRWAAIDGLSSDAPQGGA